MMIKSMASALLFLLVAGCSAPQEMPAQRAQKAKVSPAHSLEMEQLCKQSAAHRYNTDSQDIVVTSFEQFQSSYEMRGVTPGRKVLSALLTRKASFCISRCASSSIFHKQTRFILYIFRSAGILAPSFKSTRIQHEIICKSLIPGPSRA